MAERHAGGSSIRCSRLLLSLNMTQIIDNSEDACSDDDFRASLRPGHLPIRRIIIVRQSIMGSNSLPPIGISRVP